MVWEFCMSTTHVVPSNSSRREGSRGGSREEKGEGGEGNGTRGSGGGEGGRKGMGEERRMEKRGGEEGQLKGHGMWDYREGVSQRSCDQLVNLNTIMVKYMHPQILLYRLESTLTPLVHRSHTHSNLHLGVFVTHGFSLHLHKLIKPRVQKEASLPKRTVCSCRVHIRP